MTREINRLEPSDPRIQPQVYQEINRDPRESVSLIEGVRTLAFTIFLAAYNSCSTTEEKKQRCCKKLSNLLDNSVFQAFSFITKFAENNILSIDIAKEFIEDQIKRRCMSEKSNFASADVLAYSIHLFIKHIPQFQAAFESLIYAEAEELLHKNKNGAKELLKLVWENQLVPKSFFTVLLDLIEMLDTDEKFEPKELEEILQILNKPSRTSFKNILFCLQNEVEERIKKYYSQSAHVEEKKHGENLPESCFTQGPAQRLVIDNMPDIEIENTVSIIEDLLKVDDQNIFDGHAEIINICMFYKLAYEQRRFHEHRIGIPEYKKKIAEIICCGLRLPNRNKDKSIELSQIATMNDRCQSARFPIELRLLCYKNAWRHLGQIATAEGVLAPWKAQIDTYQEAIFNNYFSCEGSHFEPMVLKEMKNKKIGLKMQLSKRLREVRWKQIDLAEILKITFFTQLAVFLQDHWLSKDLNLDAIEKYFDHLRPKISKEYPGLQFGGLDHFSERQYVDLMLSTSEKFLMLKPADDVSLGLVRDFVYANLLYCARSPALNEEMKKYILKIVEDFIFYPHINTKKLFDSHSSRFMELGVAITHNKLLTQSDVQIRICAYAFNSNSKALDSLMPFEKCQQLEYVYNRILKNPSEVSLHRANLIFMQLLQHMSLLGHEKLLDLNAVWFEALKGFRGSASEIIAMLAQKKECIESIKKFSGEKGEELLLAFYTGIVNALINLLQKNQDHKEVWPEVLRWVSELKTHAFEIKS